MNNNQEKVNKIIEGLFEQLKNGHTERYINFINLMSKFHNYSLNNIFLIYGQYPQAQKVAGFYTWSKLGMKVKKGSKAIKILAPHEYRYILRDNEKVFYKNMTKEEKENKSKHHVFLTYNFVNVFDISQVDGKNKEKFSFFYQLGNDKKELYLKLKKIIEDDNILVVESEQTQGAEGLSCGGKIIIKKSIDYNNKFLTLIHEYAHEKLDQGEDSDKAVTNKQIKELRAETVSYIVSSYVGVENPFTVDYIQNHGNNAEDLRHNLEKILKCSNEIIEKMI